MRLFARKCWPFLRLFFEEKESWKLTRGLTNNLGVFPSSLDGSQSEVTDFDGEVVVMEKDVITLQIAVDDVRGMEVTAGRSREK